MLKPSARALYFAMRRYGYVRADEIDDHATAFAENYPRRDYEYCSAEISILCLKAGITRRSYYDAIANLEDQQLIERDSQNTWKVCLDPPVVHEPDYLNDKINKRFAMYV